MDFKTFDPHNPGLLHNAADTEMLVFIHVHDKEMLHNVPNLLQLKLTPNVRFVMYDDINDVKQKRYSPMLVKGGMLIADGNVLLNTAPGNEQRFSAWF